jgi:hypothetical protein
MEKENEKHEKPESDESNWERDQEKRSYYYDDAHGYEIYKPEEDEEDDEEKQI